MGNYSTAALVFDKQIALYGVSSRNGKNHTLRLGGGWNPPVERWDGHAEVQGYVSLRHTVG